MQLGYVLLQEQLFFRKELKERVFWLITLRWIAVTAGGALFFVLRGVHLDPPPSIGTVLIFVAACNAAFFFIGRRLERLQPREVKPYTRFAHLQISIDLLVLILVVYVTGGIESPLLLFILFHIILAGILLPPSHCYFYALSVLLVLGLLASSAHFGLIPSHPPLLGSPLKPAGRTLPETAVPFAIFSAVVLICAYLTTSLKTTLRIKGRELLRISLKLDGSLSRLTALYEMVKEMGERNDLKELMDGATRHAARIMGVKACSIKLVDETRGTLRFASTYGLSTDYLQKGAIEIEKSPINRKILQGSNYVIGRIQEKDYFQHPEDIRNEGIASMLCLPMKLEKRIIGVFCVYSNETYHFGEEDVKFFSLMTDLTTQAIEKVKIELTKTWFMMKAAHQLRSPLGAVYSMLKMIRGGFQGNVDPKQAETLLRCEKRIEILKEMISDLMKLGEERSASPAQALQPLDLKRPLNQSIQLYQNQAIEKGLDIRLHIDDSIPPIRASERLIDDLFNNLISNAVKYTPPGGRIEVRLTRAEGGLVNFEISDTGIGISEEDMPRLFTEFFRAENAQNLVEEGTGLGLAIVKEIVDRISGTIRVRSSAGEGTCFSCLLPADTPFHEISH
jgi:two-component sensor histidine kinase